jgi:hypothetical protein
MSNTVIQLKYSAATGNTPTALANGELAINTYDGKIFYRGGASNTIQSITRYTGPAGLDTELQFNDAGSLGGSQNLTFNKATSVLTVAGTVRANIFSNDGTDLYVFANGAFNKANASFIKANNALPNATGTFAGTLSVTETFKSLQSVGDEGGQIDLATAATNNTLSGGFVSIDIFQNKLRFFESGGTNRGVYIDMANGASAGVGTNLLAGGSTDTFARNQANAAFALANTISAGSVDTFARNQANSAFTKANGAFSAANTAQSTASSAQGTASSAASDASFALSTACTALAAASTAQDTATASFIQANAAFNKANTGSGNASFADYFPTGDWGNFTDAATSAFGEDLTVVYDCRVDPITPRGYLLTKDFGYVA